MDKLWPSIIAGALALIGVAVGGLLSGLTTYYLERRRWHREDIRRFEMDRRLAYTKLMNAVNRLLFSTEPDKKIPAEITLELTNAITEIEIIGSPEIRKHAFLFARIVADQVLDKVESPMGAWGKSRKALIDAIHSELGIDTSEEEYEVSSEKWSSIMSVKR